MLPDEICQDPLIKTQLNYVVYGLLIHGLPIANNFSTIYLKLRIENKQIVSFISIKVLV
jgi:hypothetical protein